MNISVDIKNSLVPDTWYVYKVGNLYTIIFYFKDFSSSPKTLVFSNGLLLFSNRYNYSIDPKFGKLSYVSDKFIPICEELFKRTYNVPINGWLSSRIGELTPYLNILNKLIS